MKVPSLLLKQTVEVFQCPGSRMPQLQESTDRVVLVQRRALQTVGHQLGLLLHLSLILLLHLSLVLMEPAELGGRRFRLFLGDIRILEFDGWEVLFSLLPVFLVEFLVDLPFGDLLGQLMFNFLHEVSAIEQSEANMVVVERPEVLQFEVVRRRGGGLVPAPCHHLFVVTPALDLVPGCNVLAHFNIEALRLISAAGELFCLANQKEVVVQLLLGTPVGDFLLLHGLLPFQQKYYKGLENLHHLSSQPPTHTHTTDF